MQLPETALLINGKGTKQLFLSQNNFLKLVLNT